MFAWCECSSACMWVRVCVCRYISITQLFRSLLLPVSQQNIACSAALHGMSSALVAAHETFADFPDVVYLWHASHYLGLDTTIVVTSSNVSCSWNTASYLVDNAMTHVYAWQPRLDDEHTHTSTSSHVVSQRHLIHHFSLYLAGLATPTWLDMCGHHVTCPAWPHTLTSHYTSHVVVHVTHHTWPHTCKVLLASGNGYNWAEITTTWYRVHIHCVTGCYAMSHTTPYGSILQWTRRVGSKRHAVHVVHIRVILVLIEWASARIHEEVCDRWHLQAQLLRDRCLHLLAWTFRLFEYCQQSASLYVSEHKTGFLWCRQFWLGEFIFPLACCKRSL